MDGSHGSAVLKAFEEAVIVHRRIDDDEGGRYISWDEDTRAAFVSAIDEAFKHSRKHLVEYFGVPPEIHAQQHQTLDELIPYIRAQKIKAEKQAQFWESLAKSVISDAVKWIARGVMALMLTGLAVGIAHSLGIFAELAK